MDVEKVFEMGLTPSGNTGSLDTEGSGLRALVDWVSCSFSNVKTLEDLCAILGLKVDSFEVRETGFRGYKESAIFGHIILAWGSPNNTQNMGGFIDMSGQGCREYEQHFNLELNWSEFFCISYEFFP